jgi:hypothetical protein
MEILMFFFLPLAIGCVYSFGPFFKLGDEQQQHTKK